jgi:enterochelin esterase family protein
MKLDSNPIHLTNMKSLASVCSLDLARLLRLTCLAAVLTASASAADAPPRGNPPPLVSPEVQPDRRVTFRVRAPKASEVTVSGEWPGGSAAMSRNDDGVWSVTVGPLEPDLYGYSFLLDGFRTLDPANPNVKPMRSPTTSILDVPGDQPALHDFRPEVPHGTVRLHEYRSKALGTLRRLRVYAPSAGSAA